MSSSSSCEIMYEGAKYYYNRRSRSRDRIRPRDKFRLRSRSRDRHRDRSRGEHRHCCRSRSRRRSFSRPRSRSWERRSISWERRGERKCYKRDEAYSKEYKDRHREYRKGPERRNVLSRLGFWTESMKRSGYYNPDPRRRSRSRSGSGKSLESFHQKKRSLTLSSSTMNNGSNTGSKRNIWINNRVQNKYNLKYRSNPGKEHNRNNFHCDRSNSESDDNTDFVTCDLSLTKPCYPYTPWIRINTSGDKECSNTFSDNEKWLKLVNEFVEGLRPGKDESKSVSKEQKETDKVAIKQEINEMGAKYFASGMSLHDEFKNKVSTPNITGMRTSQY